MITHSYSIMLLLLIIIIILLTIISIKFKQYNEMKKIAYTDPVTGGLNYNKFRVDAELILKSNKKEQFALVCTDIDNFSYINYTFGYKFGDKILAKISNIINKNLGTDELCARRSDDTFVLLLKFKDKNSVKKRLSLLHNKCNEIKSIKDNNYTLFMKKGIYIIHKKEYDISLIVGKAEHSKRTIKTSLTNTLSFYDDKIHKELLHEKALENSIASSLKKNEFVVYLQPKISLTTKEIIGAEALVRWQHPLEGLISPDKFIPLFESNGYIVDLDFYVYKKVCTLLKKWIDNNKPLIPISVNVSRLHVANNNFANSFKKIVDEYKIPSNLLELELTENIFLKNVSDVLNMINALKKMGFILSIDDFGCGYSSLNLLKELPVDIVKLDKGFFKPDGLDKKDKYVVSGIINIAKDLNLQVLSEGVETQEQAEFLQSSQCDMAQGFLFAKPMPIEDFETLLKETNNTI